MVNDLDNSIIFYDNRFQSDIRFVDIIPEIQSKREECLKKYGVDHFDSLLDNEAFKAQQLNKEKQEEKGPVLKLK